MKTEDPIELIVACALQGAGIRFIHESEREQSLDFFLPHHGIYIECKQFHSERIGKQIANFPDVIVIQGRAAADVFARLINPSMATNSAAS